MRRNPSASKSVRTLRVGEAVRHVLADLLARGEIRDPALDGRIVSVSEVRVSPDLRHATVFIKTVGATPAEEEAVLRALGSHARRLRHEVAQRVNTKYAADLHFRADESFAAAARIDALMRRPEVARDLGGTPGLPADDDSE